MEWQYVEGNGEPWNPFRLWEEKINLPFYCLMTTMPPLPSTSDLKPLLPFLNGAYMLFLHLLFLL